MPWLPEQIRRISLPSVVFFTLFLWNGVTYLGYARILPLKFHFRLRYLFFGLISLSLALFSFATFQLYSAVDFGHVMFWDQLQLAAMVFTFICFVLFTAIYLERPHFYFFTVVPIVSLLFLPFVFWKGMFFKPEAVTRTFSFFGYSTHAHEAVPGPFYYYFLIWTLPQVFYLVWRWIQHFLKGEVGWLLPLGSAVFILTAVNDTLIVLDVYHFFYILELGFVILTLSMAFQLFKFYVRTMKELDHKIGEVADLNEELQFLVSSISHDLKAPLISIGGFADLVKDMGEEEHEKRRDFLQRIAGNAQQMLSLLDDLINFMKVGWVLGDSELVNLAKVVEEVMDMLSTTLAERHIEIQFPEAWPEIFSSTRGIKQILLNLLQNALKFSPDSSVVKIEGVRDSEALRLWVEDQGPGVPHELGEKIFQPFYRHNRQVSGTGMGLAIVKKTAEKLGGRVWLDSSRNRGARFCVLLPDRKARRER